VIRFENVTKYYDNQAALKNVTFGVERGEFAFVSGPSGAGKTTILKLIFRAERFASGEVVVDGRNLSEMREGDVPHLRRKIGVVFQDFRLLNRTVFENVALALRIRSVTDSYVRERTLDVLKMVNLRHKSDSLVTAISGGEQQRVAIARAIVGEPSILLCDEPTGNLDPDTATGILRIFSEINARGITIFLATHNRGIFRRSGKRVFRISGGAVEIEAGL
jgi:cell division transport system ATP-binding protein